MSERLELQYFSDVLCVWAYVAQARLDELRRKRGEEIAVEHHFVPVFGAVDHRIGDGWRRRGGYAGYADHVAGVCGQFDHVELHPDTWRATRPASSAPAHAFLRALLLSGGEAANRFEEAAWALRLAFFRDARDVSSADVLHDVGTDLGLPLDAMRDELDSGRALAAVSRDAELVKELGIEGSPTYVLNDGRQKLYGNVGYKVIEANVEELLHRPVDGASWC